jgi:predicted nucleic acid-binding protein
MSCVPRLYLDANIFIAIKEIAGPAADLLLRLLARARDRSCQLLTSELTSAGVLTKPLAQDRRDPISHYDLVIRDSSWLTVAPVNRVILRSAAALRAAHRSLKLPDAIHLATALETSCPHMLTADQGVKGHFADAWSAGQPQGQSDPLAIVRPDTATLEQLLADTAGN